MLLIVINKKEKVGMFRIRKCMREFSMFSLIHRHPYKIIMEDYLLNILSNISPINYLIAGNLKLWVMVSWYGMGYGFKFFKGCLPKILFGPLLNTLSHIYFDI